MFRRLVGVILCALFSMVITQKYRVTLLSINKCPVDIGDHEIDYEIGLKGNAEKFFSLKANIKEELNDNFTFKANVLVNNGYTMIQYMEANGKICDAIANGGKPAFERFKKEIRPVITEPCRVYPGKYVLSKFSISKDEVDVPIPTNGKFKSDVHAYNPEGYECLCLEAEFLIEEEEE